MSLSNSQKALIRQYMCVTVLGATIGTNNVFENTLNSVDSITDGGATVALIITALTNIQTVETQIQANSQLFLASDVTGEVKVDAARADAMLRKVGSAYINQLAIPLGIRPVARYFYPLPADDSGDFHLHNFGS